MSYLAHHRGPVVVAAGTGINLALGVLYAWSLFKDAIRQSIERGGEGAFEWELASVNDPYAVACLVFALMMIVAGRIQDRHGPRLTATIGGLLVGAGFLLIAQTNAYWGWIAGFGLLVGSGIAFGYASATPVALKWFPPSQTGKIAGTVVSGFGLASVYIAPLATWLVASYGLPTAMQVLGIGFLIVVSLLATLLVPPPAGYVPPGFVERRKETAENQSRRDSFPDQEYSPRELLTDRHFWVVWLLYLIGAGAGLMVIGSVAGMAKGSLGSNAFLAVAILAVGNAGGRIVAGILSDHYGRAPTLLVLYLIQSLLMFAAIPVTTTGAAGNGALLVLLATFIGFNYGANLALFPAITKDLWGIAHFGQNYGLLFTAWGIGGFILSRVSETLHVATGAYTGGFLLAGSLLILGAMLTLWLINHPIKRERRAIRRQLQSDQA